VLRPRVLSDRRFVFAVQFKDDMAPAIVKLGRSFGVASSRRRTDAQMSARGDADWDLIGRELRQDLVRPRRPVEQGAALSCCRLEPRAWS
jgi:hypothetical protein